MEIKIETGASHERKLQVQIPWEEMAGEYEKQLNKLNKQVKRPGFRPGKIPRQIMTRTYGPAVLADMVEDWAQRAFYQAAVENKWEPITQGKLENLEEFDEGQDLKFELLMEIEPEVTLPKYKSGFKVTRPEYEPTDEDVNHALEHLRERYAEVEPRTDGAVEGDLIKGDLQYLDGSGLPIVGSRVEDRYIKVGEGVFGGQVAETLHGAKTGDEIRFDIPAPTEKDEDLHVLLNVKAVETEHLPDLNDDFAKLVNPELENLDALKEVTLADIRKQLEQDARRAFHQGLAEYMVENAKVEIPETMITDYLDRLIQRLEQERPGEVDEAKVRETNRDRAIWELKWYLIRKRLVRDEELNVSDDDVEARIDDLTADMDGDTSKLRALYKDKQTLPQLKEDILDRKVFEHLAGNAKIKDKKISTKEIGGYHGHAH